MITSFGYKAQQTEDRLFDFKNLYCVTVSSRFERAVGDRQGSDRPLFELLETAYQRSERWIIIPGCGYV